MAHAYNKSSYGINYILLQLGDIKEESDDEYSDECLEEDIVEYLMNQNNNRTETAIEENDNNNAPGPSRKRKSVEDEKSLRIKLMKVVADRLGNHPLQAPITKTSGFIEALQTELDMVPTDMLPYAKKVLMEVVALGQTGNLTSTSYVSQRQ